MECQDFIYRLVRKNAPPSRRRQKAARFFEKFPRPGGQASAGTGHRCTEAVAGHSRRVVKCAVQGGKPLCIPPGSETDIQLFQRPESIRQLGDSRTDIEQQRQYGEHTAEKIRYKFPTELYTTRFDRSLKKWTVFLLSTFTSVENLAKNMFSFSIEMLHSRRCFPHRRLCPSRLQIQNILGAGHGAGNASSEVR